jgi:hypothetical protein
MKPAGFPIVVSASLGSSDPLDIRSGGLVVPTERMKLFSPAEWEGFVNEWAFSLAQYKLVERAGGSGDMGCDVIGTVDPDDPNGPWDNYQCKHYDHPLGPADIWIELGKVCYHTFLGDYSQPRRYYFVAPRGVGTKLSRLLKKPAELKAGLLEEWGSKCAASLVAGKTITLDAAMRAHIETIDFSRIAHVPPLSLIEGHAKTRYFSVRFGLGLPARPTSPLPPADVARHETRYVQQLLEAYSDHLQLPVDTASGLSERLQRHFGRARESFYCAEALRNFSRDTLPDGAFENLQKQIFDGVVNVAEAQHACGLTRVNATTAQAATLALTSSALLGRVEVVDRHGVCHQLANDDKLTWVPQDE